MCTPEDAEFSWSELDEDADGPEEAANHAERQRVLRGVVRTGDVIECVPHMYHDMCAK